MGVSINRPWCEAFVVCEWACDVVEAVRMSLPLFAAASSASVTSAQGSEKDGG